MPITPAGNPVWLRQNGIVHYGGHTDKKNYQSRGAVNGRTDVTAENICRIAADLVAIGRTAPFASFTVTCNDTSPAAPTISDDEYEALAMAGGAPTGLRVSDGKFTLDWEPEYTDAFGVVGYFHLLSARVSMVGSLAGLPTYEISDEDADGRNERLTVTVFDDGGVALPDAVVSIDIFPGPTS